MACVTDVERSLTVCKNCANFEFAFSGALRQEVLKLIRGDLMLEKVQAALDKIRPSLEADGGDVKLIEVTDGVVKLKLTGACAGCPMSQMTLKNGIERVLKREVPEVKSVVAA